MTRRLPWKKTEAAEAASPSSLKQQRESPRQASIKREAPVASSPLTQTRLPVTPRKKRVTDRDFTRSPSTSPPPEPPKEELMIPGVERDDRYRMVEDEFLAVARLFTTHLHRAEYARLRTLAASQNAAAIREIERPVVAGSRQTAEARRKGEVRKREVRQRSVMGEGEDEGSVTGLMGLLESPRRDRRSIGRGLVREGLKTRAGAGFRERIVRGQGTRREEAGDEAGEETADEPELPPLRLTSTVRREEASPTEAESSTHGSRAKPRTTGSAKTRPRDSAVVEIDDDDDDPFGITRRKARREKSKEQLRRTEAVIKPQRDTMPSFL